MEKVAFSVTSFQSNLSVDALQTGISAAGYVPGEEPKPIGQPLKYKPVQVDSVFLWTLENARTDSDGLPLKNLFDSFIDKLVKANI